jgi:putative spermidine/putrescine transport system ATP-binding protein
VNEAGVQRADDVSDMAPLQPLAIKVRGATKKYGPVAVLDDVSLDVQPGEFLTLLGPSGSGKTTLLNIIAGFVRPDQGTIFINDEDVTDTPPHRRGIGIVFQNYALFPHMSVGENVAFSLKARGIPRSEIGSKVERALSIVKLGGFGDRRIDQLSGGQKQRVALARAIVFQPTLILMDEPLSALDKQLREHMQIEIRALHDRLGATTIYVTHDQREALTMSHRVAVLNEARIVQIGTPSEIYNLPADGFVADFIGEGVLAPVTRCDDHSVLLQGLRMVTTQPLPSSEHLVLVIRSEKMRLAKPGDENRFQAVIRKRIFQGESYVLFAEMNDGLKFTIRQPAHTESDGLVPMEGDHATFSLHPDHTVVVRRDGSAMAKNS